MTTTDNESRGRWQIRNGLFVVALISLAVLLGYMARENRIQWDVSQNARNSLSPASLAVLKKLNGPLAVAVYATAYDAQLGNIRKIIGEFLSLYQRAKPDMTVTFIDPAEQPHLAQQAGIQANGEIIVAFDGRRERLASLNEQAFTNVLFQLARPRKKIVAALAGHGERKFDGATSRDLGSFGEQLASKGFKIENLNLSIDWEVPAETDVLVISSPQIELQKEEVAKLITYVARGGNLLWLIDSEPLHGLQPLAENLALTLTPGVVIDPQARQLNLPVTFAVGANYGQHRITADFEYTTVFPFARQVTVNDNDEWRSLSLVDVAAEGWVETGSLDGKMTFDKMYDVAGPVSIAVALSRNLQEREQRVAVVGTGYFLANDYLGQGKNLDLGINLMNWLAGDENLIAIQPRATLDSSLNLNETVLGMISVGFLLVLPLVFVITGVIIWRKRTKN
jgi:ABC-type uncharacterized transport system involved in gliding motility auxiliary subunit